MSRGESGYPEGMGDRNGFVGMKREKVQFQTF